MLAVNSQPNFSHLNSKIILPRKQCANAFVPCQIREQNWLCLHMVWKAQQVHERTTMKQIFATQAVSSGLEDTQVSSSQFQDFSVSTCSTDKGYELKLSIEVSGTKTQAAFDDVFSEMVADAQPISGFRRVKGGKTPNIPTDILLEILGPSKVYKQVITQVINSTFFEYVKKEGLTVSKDLKVVQSFEDLEAVFEPGDPFRFEAILQCKDSN